MDTFRNATALIVEDADAMSQFVSQVLRLELGFGKLLHASNGKQGLELFSNNAIDWIFCDIEMPEMDGFALLDAVRTQQHGKQLPFILMSCHRSKDTISKAIAAGATDFLGKPFSAALLIEKVRRIGLPAETKNGSRQRRYVARLKLANPVECQVQFSQTAIYSSQIVNISIFGCLLRSSAFDLGGAIYGKADLHLSVNGKPLTIKAVLRRMEAEQQMDELNDAVTGSILSGFQFVDVNAATLQIIKKLGKSELMNQY